MATNKLKKLKLTYYSLTDIFYILEDNKLVSKFYTRDQLLARLQSIFCLDTYNWYNVIYNNLDLLISKKIRSARQLRSDLTRYVQWNEVKYRRKQYFTDLVKQIILLRIIKRLVKSNEIYILVDCSGG